MIYDIHQTLKKSVEFESDINSLRHDRICKRSNSRHRLVSNNRRRLASRLKNQVKGLVALFR